MIFTKVTQCKHVFFFLQFSQQNYFFSGFCMMQIYRPLWSSLEGTSEFLLPFHNLLFQDDFLFSRQKFECQNTCMIFMNQKINQSIFPNKNAKFLHQPKCTLGVSKKIFCVWGIFYRTGRGKHCLFVSAKIQRIYLLPWQISIAHLAFLNQVTAKHRIQITFMNPKYEDKIPIWQKDALFHKLIKNLIIVLLERCICKNNTLEAG